MEWNDLFLARPCGTACGTYLAEVQVPVEPLEIGQVGLERWAPFGG